MASVLPRVCVGVITRERPRMLEALLASLTKIDCVGLECVFAIVENNDVVTMGKIADAFAKMRADASVVFEIEPQLGIPFARNHVLDIALREQADMLAFIDDDETADRDWLQNLVLDKINRNLDLVGGPVRLQPSAVDLSLLQRLVWRGLADLSRRGERKAALLRLQDRDGRLALATNNWLADLGFLRKTGLRFDESLGLSGGEDTRLFIIAKSEGARSGWAPNAVVYESLSKDRLKLSYQYLKSCDTAATSFNTKYPRLSVGIVLRAAASILGKCVTGLLYLARAFWDSGGSLVNFAHALGFVVGRLRALRRVKAAHYKQVTGH